MTSPNARLNKARSSLRDWEAELQRAKSRMLIAEHKLSEARQAYTKTEQATQEAAGRVRVMESSKEKT